MNTGINAINEAVQEASAFLRPLFNELGKVIVGQTYLVERLVIGLLEAMQEKQVTIGEQTFRLEEPFLVLATQNPIEQEGTYPLPEAQVDRFMLKLKIGYPARAEERQILDLMARTSGTPVTSAVV